MVSPHWSPERGMSLQEGGAFCLKDQLYPQSGQGWQEEDMRETSVERRHPSLWNKQSTCFLEESQGSDLIQEPVRPQSTPTAVSGCEQL